MGFVNADTYVDVIAPLMVVEKTCIIGISTLGTKSTAFFNRLINSNVGVVHRVCYVCEPCQKRGIREKCVHKLDSIPHFNSASKLEKILELVGEGHRSNYERENLGLDTNFVTSDRDNCFKPEEIRTLLTRPRCELTRPIQQIIFTVDPVAGSDISEKRSSDFTIYSLSSPGNIILGVEALDVVRMEDYEDKMVRHLQRIRAMRFCEDATIVVDAEAFTGLEASNIQRIVQNNFANVVLLNEGRVPGTRTTETSKEEMVKLAQIAFSHGEVGIARNLVTSHHDPSKLIHEMGDQLMSFERIVVVGAHRNRVKYSGKGPNGDKKDDLAMTLLRAIRTKHRYLYPTMYTNSRG